MNTRRIAWALIAVNVVIIALIVNLREKIDTARPLLKATRENRDASEARRRQLSEVTREKSAAVTSDAVRPGPLQLPKPADVEKRAKAIARLRALLPAEYSQFTQRTKLDPQSLERFYDRLSLREQLVAEITRYLDKQSGVSPEDAREFYAVATKEVDDQLRDLLGNDSYLGFQKYRDGVLVRLQLEKVRSILRFEANDELTSDQMDRLVGSICSHSERLASGLYAVPAVLPAESLEEAQKILSERQQNELKAFADVQAAVVSMTKMVADGSSDKRQ